MRITCQYLEDVLENLETGRPHRNTVYFDRTSKPNGNGSPRTAVSFDVYFQVTAVLEFEDGTQALLVYGEFCGTDRRTSDGGTEGMDRMRELLGQLQDFCGEKGLVLRPGILDA